jgi:pimeloyl-ACP methyl ester carboxylesterase
MVLIRGLGSSGYAWGNFAEALARHFRVLWFDNRGAGRSAAPEGPYSTRQMADDAAGLLRQLTHLPAHVVSVSLGGMIAQELAINHPEVVRTLVLGCTDFGGKEAVRARSAAQGLIPSTDAEDSARRAVQAIYSAEWLQSNPEEVAEIIARRSAYPASPAGFEAQRQAYLGHDCADRLDRIRAPVLLLTGTADGVVPAENSRLLVARIPGAELISYPGAGHGFFDERRPQVVADIIGFISRRAR